MKKPMSEAEFESFAPAFCKSVPCLNARLLEAETRMVKDDKLKGLLKKTLPFFDANPNHANDELELEIRNALFGGNAIFSGRT